MRENTEGFLQQDKRKKPPSPEGDTTQRAFDCSAILVGKDKKEVIVKDRWAIIFVFRHVGTKRRHVPKRDKGTEKGGKPDTSWKTA